MGSFLRRPLGLFAVIVVVGLILIAGGMAAFGGTSSAGSPYPKPLTPGQFDHVGVGICLSMRSQLKWLAAHKPKNLRELQTYIERATAMYDGLRVKVRGIVPPAYAAAGVRRLLTKLDALDRVMRHLNHLAETRQWRSAISFVRSRAFRKLEGRVNPHWKPSDMHCRGVAGQLV
ncbi:MAG TPA: hypothetical protein VE985_09620 [Gaiellaceae bacterium]|nr:hypothetical protein [Gaiellaceae bacterium]